MDHPCSAPCLHPLKLGSAGAQTKRCELSQHGRVQLKAVPGPWHSPSPQPTPRRRTGGSPRAGALHFDDLRHPRDLPHGHQQVQAVALVEEQLVSLRLALGESQQGLHRLPHLQRHRPHLKQSQTKPNPDRPGRFPAVPARGAALPCPRPWLPRRHVWPPPSGARRGPAAPSGPPGSGSGRGLAAGGRRGRARLGAVCPGGGFTSGRAAPARPAHEVGPPAGSSCSVSPGSPARVPVARRIPVTARCGAVQLPAGSTFSRPMPSLLSVPPSPSFPAELLSSHCPACVGTTPSQMQGCVYLCCIWTDICVA